MSKRPSHRELKAKWLKDPKFKKEYDSIGDEFELLEKMLKARKKSGLTQAEVAALMGTSTSVVGRLETGGHSPTVETLERYAEAMGYKIKIDFIPEKRIN